MDGLPFAVALMTTDELRNGDVATIEYLLPSFSITSPTSVSPIAEVTPITERAHVTAATVEEVSDSFELFESSTVVVGGGPTTATNVDVPGKMC